ncbi:MAG: phage major capsid protein [Rhodothermales bacterium]|nr:phage major capsid protein [Rhodothermales bacterium]
MPELSPALKAELDRLAKNNARIDELEKSIKADGEIGKGVADLKQQVNNIVNDTAEANDKVKTLVEDLTRRVDEAEAKAKTRYNLDDLADEALKTALNKAKNDHALGPQFKGRHSFDVSVDALGIGRKGVTNLGASGGALLTPMYRPGVVEPGVQQVAVRNLLGGGPTDSTVIIWFRELAVVGDAAYQAAQGDLKAEVDLTYEEKQSVVRDIAEWIYVSRQMLDDVPYLRAQIEGRLRYLLEYKIDREILNGAGGASAMEGLNTVATAFDVTLMTGVTNKQKLDVLRKAQVQVGRTFYPATGHVLNPEDVADIELIKDSTGSYIFANPGASNVLRPWGMDLAQTYAQTKGTFTSGAFRIAAEYWQREDVRVEISTEDGDNFRRNRATLLVEARGTTAIIRPDAIVKGTFAAALA